MKPHPESYQKVIEHFHIDPAEVLVFEDSLRGVQSAKSAGTSVASIHYEYAERDRDEIIALSDFYINTWQELLSVLK
ncbi:Phosphorylated carbohydrates phosphatase [compost metagenome]